MFLKLGKPNFRIIIGHQFGVQALWLAIINHHNGISIFYLMRSKCIYFKFDTQWHNRMCTSLSILENIWSALLLSCMLKPTWIVFCGRCKTDVFVSKCVLTIIEYLIGLSKFHSIYLDITNLTLHRSDSHISTKISIETILPVTLQYE